VGVPTRRATRAASCASPAGWGCGATYKAPLEPANGQRAGSAGASQRPACWLYPASHPPATRQRRSDPSPHPRRIAADRDDRPDTAAVASSRRRLRDRARDDHVSGRTHPGRAPESTRASTAAVVAIVSAGRLIGRPRRSQRRASRQPACWLRFGQHAGSAEASVEPATGQRAGCWKPAESQPTASDQPARWLPRSQRAGQGQASREPADGQHAGSR
jgi:hypothetical protein